MHELSLAEALIIQIIDVAKENNLSSVSEVEIEAGVLRQVIPEVMQEAYRSVIDGTIAEGSILKITEIRSEARCRKCNKVFEPEINNYLCANCNIANVDILKGNDIILKSVVSYERSSNEG